MASLLEEKDAIHETIAEYCFHFDGGEFDKWVDLFTDDGVFDAGRLGVQKGKDALRAFLKNIRLTNGSPMVKHCVMNEVIKVNGNEATAKSYIVLVRAKGEGALVNGLAGRYEDQLVKQGDHWRFKNRKVHFDLMGDMA
ncbi:MAG TPA: nuclear transport factor 2 family protein [Candidatus Binatia bacterium]|jgi:ketosteroid isomerase-like protein|nr:nuclear transport factor 2 family protein [Candidatus Binatia bacterium]